MTIGHIMKRVEQFELVIKKGCGLVRPIKITFINPTPSEYVGQFCPVAILTAYLASRQRLASASDSNFLFPIFLSHFDPITKRQIITIHKPHAQIKYDNFRCRLQTHLDSHEIKVLGVSSQYYSS